MLQTIKAWNILIYFGERSIKLIIDDNHYSNVLRKLAEIRFEQDPIKVEINLRSEFNQTNSSMETK